jgi:hypothetical protein
MTLLPLVRIKKRSFVVAREDDDVDGCGGDNFDGEENYDDDIETDDDEDGDTIAVVVLTIIRGTVMTTMMTIGMVAMIMTIVLGMIVTCCGDY